MYFSIKNPTQTYYHLTSRIFEFLIGSCIVFIPATFNFNKYVTNFLNFIALILLFFIAMHSNVNDGFPNWYSVIVSLATGLLIINNKDPRHFFSKILSFKPLVFIGLISYSLYIWHWPILATIRYLGIAETPKILILTTIIIFLVAILSWKFIEKPSRKFHKLKINYSIIFLFILPIILFHGVDYIAKKYSGYPGRFNELVTIENKLNQYVNPQRALCLHDKNVEINKNCTLGASNPNSKRGFMIGDSQANQFWQFMDYLAKKTNITILADSLASCLALPEIQQYDWNKKIYTACEQQVKNYYAMIKANHYDYVIIGQNWSGYLTKLINKSSQEAEKQIAQSLDQAIKNIITSGSRPILIRAITPGNSYNCFLKHIKKRSNYNSQNCEYEMPALTWEYKLFAEMKRKYPELIIIDPKKVHCRNRQCVADLHGIPIFRDNTHINDYAAHHFAVSYLKKYNNPFLS